MGFCHCRWGLGMGNGSSGPAPLLQLQLGGVWEGNGEMQPPSAHRHGFTDPVSAAAKLKWFWDHEPVFVIGL